MKKNINVLERIANIVFIICLPVVTALAIMGFWHMATASVGMSAECEVDEIVYRDFEGDGECVFLLAYSDSLNMSTCGFPKDIHCKGDVESFPLFRAIKEWSW